MGEIRASVTHENATARRAALQGVTMGEIRASVTLENRDGHVCRRWQIPGPRSGLSLLRRL